VLAAKVRGLSQRHDGVDSLQDIDLDLPLGILVTLIGPNGAGKTTLLRILGGFLRPTEGWVEVLGVADPYEADRTEQRALRRRLAYLPQEPALDPGMTGRETLELMASLQGLTGTERRERTRRLAASYGIAGYLDQRVETWPGGLKQRLHLAAGMIHDPELLLLDEPTADLDPEGSSLLWRDLVVRANNGRTVLTVSHDLKAVERYAHGLIMLNQGEIVVSGPPRSLPAELGDTDLAAMFRRLSGQEPDSVPTHGGKRRP
jgi:ABC-2 type transport system ATP-binding protein